MGYDAKALEKSYRDCLGPNWTNPSPLPARCDEYMRAMHAYYAEERSLGEWEARWGVTVGKSSVNGERVATPEEAKHARDGFSKRLGDLSQKIDEIEVAMKEELINDPLAVLGLPREATPQQVYSAYALLRSRFNAGIREYDNLVDERKDYAWDWVDALYNMKMHEFMLARVEKAHQLLKYSIGSDAPSLEPSHPAKRWYQIWR